MAAHMATGTDDVICLEEDDFAGSGPESESDDDCETGFAPFEGGVGPEEVEQQVGDGPLFLADYTVFAHSEHDGDSSDSEDDEDEGGVSGAQTVDGCEDGGGDAPCAANEDEDSVRKPVSKFNPKDIKGELIAYCAIDLETTSSKHPPFGNICSIGATFVCWGVDSAITHVGDDMDEDLTSFDVKIDPGLPAYAWNKTNVRIHGMTAETNRGKTAPKIALIDINGYFEKIVSYAEEYRKAHPDSPPKECVMCFITHNGKGELRINRVVTM